MAIIRLRMLTLQDGTYRTYGSAEHNTQQMIEVTGSLYGA